MARREAPPPADRAARDDQPISELDNRLTKLEHDLTVLEWMVGCVIGLVLLVLGKLFA